MTSHIDTETLALLAEGLLEEDEENSTQAHVTECDRCRSQMAALADVSRVLAEVPAPPLPDGLVDRIDDALRHEAEKRTDSPTTVDDGHGVVVGGEVLALPPRSGPPRWLPYLAAAAAAVFVVGGGAAVVSNITPTGDKTGAGSTAFQEETSEREAASAYRPFVVSSGTDYTDDELAEQGEAVLEDSPLANGAESTADGAAEEPLPDSPTLSGDIATCVRELSSRSQERPVLIDRATYEGAPAWIMLFRTADSYNLQVMSTKCGESVDPAGATLAETTLP
ncbi:hypothetical protein [Salinactinospora qingdaonensis]|uniref:Zinc-finger n=1 Tax=Salinactinospora qingdaonensis TaxID=702744 RepID=A0ABP7FAJ8_9ACTN